MADSVEMEAMPCEPIMMPMDKPLNHMETVTLNVPVKIHEHAIASDKVFELPLTFRGPKGNGFGEQIVLKMKVCCEAD